MVLQRTHSIKTCSIQPSVSLFSICNQLPVNHLKVQSQGGRGKARGRKGGQRMKVEGGHALGVKSAGLIPDVCPGHHAAGSGSAPEQGGRQAESDSPCLELPVKLRSRLVIFLSKKINK